VDGFPFPKGTGLIRGQSQKNLRMGVGFSRLPAIMMVEAPAVSNAEEIARK
jgi:hypothetical protein